MIARLALLVGALRGLLGARRGTPFEDGTPAREAAIDPTQHELPATPRREAVLAGLLLVSCVLLLAFAVCVVAAPNTQVLGILLGGGLLVLAAALIHAGKAVLPQDTVVEPRPELAQPEEQVEVERDLAATTRGISRRRLLTGAAGAATTGLGAAVAVPVLTSIGPGPQVLDDSPWAAGKILVDEEGTALVADDLVEGGFRTAFPLGADKRELGSPVVVVRVDPATLRLPRARAGWAPEGLVAFSKVCTHAGCAVSLYRSPLYEPQSEPPGLVCPCHYSTFDVRTGGDVVFGPAGRPLPQLPLRLDDRRRLVAAGPLFGSVGPAWWGTDRAGT